MDVCRFNHANLHFKLQTPHVCRVLVTFTVYFHVFVWCGGPAVFVRAVVPAPVTLLSFSELTHSLGLTVGPRQRGGLSLCSGKVSCVEPAVQVYRQGLGCSLSV